MPPFLEARNISKFFGSLKANEAVDLSVAEGEIHGIVGENGAGKSTLMKILYGMYRPDVGEIFVRGKKIYFKNPSEALSAGIGMVHQHFMLVNRMSVIENLILGAEPTIGGVIDEKRALREFERISAEMGSKLQANSEVGDLSVGEQQSLEILKLLFRKSDCLIFDEPTGVLTPQEVDLFLKSLLDLKAKGKTIILITHKLNEILCVADRISVLRAGRSVASVDAKSTTASELARLMVGRDIKSLESSVVRKPQGQRQALLRVESLYSGGLKNINFELHPGEILGIAGIEGNGQRQIAESLWGLQPIERGSLHFDGQEISKLTSLERKRAGISFVPENRHRDALVLDMNLLENLYLTADDRPCLFPKSRLRTNLQTAIDLFDIKTPSAMHPVRELSGGNQQKFILARELQSKPKLLIAAQPTRGVDIGAIERIHQELMERRNNGMAILLISCELDELLALSDRILVLRNFEISTSLEDLRGDPIALRYKIGEAMICPS